MPAWSGAAVHRSLPVSTFIPAADAPLITWLTDHAERWVQTQGEIGLSPQRAAAIAADVAQMVEDWRAYEDAKQALTAARERWLAGRARGVASASAGAKIIKAFAADSADPSAVYTAASIPAPKEMVVGVAPGRPTAVRCELNTVTGEARLSWRCRNPRTTRGTVYIVQRRARAGDRWETLGVSSVRSFTDTTLTAGSSVEYQVTAVRGGVTGEPSGPVVVALGRAGAGEGGGGVRMAG